MDAPTSPYCSWPTDEGGVCGRRAVARFRRRGKPAIDRCRYHDTYLARAEAVKLGFRRESLVQSVT